MRVEGWIAERRFRGYATGDAMALNKLGVWAGLDGRSAADAAAFAKRVEAWGYGALWIPEAIGREVFTS